MPGAGRGLGGRPLAAGLAGARAFLVLGQPANIDQLQQRWEVFLDKVLVAFAELTIEFLLGLERLIPLLKILAQHFGKRILLPLLVVQDRPRASAFSFIASCCEWIASTTPWLG